MNMRAGSCRTAITASENDEAGRGPGLEWRATRAYLPKRYVVNAESMRSFWPALKRSMQESSV